MNTFENILLSKGFTLGATGRYLNPEFRFGNGMVVEVTDEKVSIMNMGMAAIFYLDDSKAVENFRNFLGDF